MKLFLFILLLFSYLDFFVTRTQTFPTLVGNYVTDLYPDTAGDFTSMTLSWTVNTNAVVAAMTTVCQVTVSDTFPMLGGDILSTYPDPINVPYRIATTYNSLPTHQSVYYQVKILIKEDWDAHLEIYIDTTQVYDISPKWKALGEPRIDCPSSSSRYVPLTFTGTAAHSGSTLTFTVRSPGFFKFGIRDLQLRFDPDPLSASVTNCMVITVATYRTDPAVCSCDPGRFYTLGSCNGCDGSCNQCFGPLENQCFGCAEGYTYDADTGDCTGCTDGCLICSGPGLDECLQCSAYIYANSSCITGCTSPYQQRGVTQYCDPMCTAPTQYFHENDSQCYSTCDSGLIKDGFICSEAPNTGGSTGGGTTGTSKTTLTESEKSYIETTTQTSSTVNDITTFLGKTISLINFSNPGAIFMASFAELIRYIKYMRIEYPEKLRYSLDLELELPIQIIPDAPDSLGEYLVQATIPENFEGDDFHSSFLWNFWDSLITFTILGAGILLVILTKPCAGKYKRIRPLMTEAHQSLLWNFSLPFFTSSFADIVLFSSFELQTAEYSISNGLSIFSLTLCCAFNLLAILSFIKMVLIVRTHWYQVINGQDSQVKSNTQNQLSPYQVVYECCKKKSLYQQAFMPIFVGRIYLFVTIIAYLYNYPIMQAMLITVLSATMLLYLLITRPIEGWVDMTNYVLQELVMLNVMACTLILSALDPEDSDNTTVRENLGEVIINSNIAFCGISLVYVVIQLMPLVKSGYLRLRAYLKKSKSLKTQDSETKLKIKPVPRLDNSHNTSIDPLRDVEPNTSINGILDENSSPQASFTMTAYRIKRSQSRSPLYPQNRMNY